MTPWVTRIIIANVVMFVVTLAAPEVTGVLSFIPVLLASRPWTLVTYMFLHAGIWHLFFNMLALYFFGPRLELEIGSRHFLWLYFVSGVVGGLLSFVFTPYTQIVGASGAVFGVLLGFARYWPRERIYIWGVLPIEARWLVVIMTGLALFGGFGIGMSGIAHFAHLGGFLGGYLYMKFMERETGAKKLWEDASARMSSKKDLVRWSRIERERMHEVNRAEYDRVMEKIKTEGVGSLTADERAFLDRFSPEQYS